MHSCQPGRLATASTCHRVSHEGRSAEREEPSSLLPGAFLAVGGLTDRPLEKVMCEPGMAVAHVRGTQASSRLISHQ